MTRPRVGADGRCCRARQGHPSPTPPFFPRPKTGSQNLPENFSPVFNNLVPRAPRLLINSLLA